MISAALLALMMPALAAAENSSLYRVTGETGTVHIYPTPELSRQIKAERGLAHISAKAPRLNKLCNSSYPEVEVNSSSRHENQLVRD